MLKKVSKNAAALVMAGIMAMGSVPMVSFAADEAGIVPVSAELPWGNNISPADRRATGPYAMQIEMSTANYRNLSITPGATVNEMRWTWHSRSEAGAIRIYQAGSNAPISLGGAVVTSRPLGYGLNSTLGVTDANPLGTGGLATGLSPRSAVSEGATGIHSYPWFSYEEGTANDYWVHQITVFGLTADTAYEYVITGEIEGNSFTSTRKPFRTGPDRNSGFTFTAGGDPQIGIGDFTPGREAHGNNIPNPGIGSKSHVEDYTGWTNAVEIMAAYAPNAGFFLPVGDQIDTNDGAFRRSQFMYDIWFAPEAFHSLPVLPVIGNHEANNNGWLFHQHFNTPIDHSTSADPADNIRMHAGNPWQFDYYTIWGNTLIITLDSNTRNWGEGRLEWLENVINTYQPTVEWTLVTFHHPPYSVFRATNLGEKQQLIANWLPEFERLGVDIVLNGHCHVYSRTHQMYQNAPVLTQNWVQADGSVVRGTTPTSVVYDPTGIVYIAFNSMSGSGYRNVRNMGGRNYISAYNQNFRRNFSVIDVTNYSFAVHTYQINDDGVSVSLVDTYTLVRGGHLAEAAQADPRGLRQITCPEQGVDTDVINVGVVPNTARQADTAITAEALGLPSTVEIEIHTSNNQREEDALGMLGARGLRDELNSYDFRVRPMRVAVNWDLSGIPANANAREGQTFTVTGELDLSRIIGTAQTYPLPAPVSNDAEFTLAGVTQPCPFRGRHVTFQGTPDLIMEWRHGGITNSNNLTATAQVTFGADTLEAPFRLSEFGATTFHYAPRTAEDFFADSLDRNIFQAWHPVRSGAGFGYFANGYHDVPMLITDTPPTIPLPGLQFRGAMGATALTNMGTIQYSPVGYDENATFHYFSRVFYLPTDFNPANIAEVLGSHRIDDNLILFINGVEVYRFNTSTNNNLVRIGEEIDWAGFNGHEADARNRNFHINYDFSSRYAGTRAANSDISVFDAASRTNLISALQPGQNILTAVVGDNSANSMDVWFDLDLTINYN
ncbi:MAG: metallophosphoesterase [Defluviitaleaceae bacterium]|nr:metallophosphoesterase [Defluviitaleaceae bacterium]